MRIPVYGDSITFRQGERTLTEEASGDPALWLDHSRGTSRARIGYDLFAEVRVLLTAGQPSLYAANPTMERHIGLLRELIVAHRIPLAEIPPVPAGFSCIACLTHDVDHPSLRLHQFDPTMFGFLYRSTAGSLVEVLLLRRDLRSLVKNCWAALKLPFVHLRLARDFWADFDRYTKLENGLPSSFFVIPFKHLPGRTAAGSAPCARASAYGADDIPLHLERLQAAGCEIGVHGIDAWIDTGRGREELATIRRLVAMPQAGIRMHWLYFDEHSPVVLERAGFDYDASSGYNETVGYRAGTTQVFRPLPADRLLELPLHIMDTALFFPNRLYATRKEAKELVDRIIHNAIRWGGCVTVNWHDRSIAPERQWGDFYLELVKDLQSRGAWFATASKVVAWFRKRRSARFEMGTSGQVQIEIAPDVTESLPDLQLRIHNGCEAFRNATAVNAN
jgi:hypothetical protein